jgi:hypothetical protein
MLLSYMYSVEPSCYRDVEPRALWRINFLEEKRAVFLNPETNPAVTANF